MTGFRVALKGAQSLFNVTPDITMLGKVIGGGMPVPPLAGVVNHGKDCALRPGLSSRHPVGQPCCRRLRHGDPEENSAPGFYDRLGAQTKRLVEGLQAAAQAAGVPSPPTVSEVCLVSTSCRSVLRALQT